MSDQSKHNSTKEFQKGCHKDKEILLHCSMLLNSHVYLEVDALQIINPVRQIIPSATCQGVSSCHDSGCSRLPPLLCRKGESPNSVSPWLSTLGHHGRVRVYLSSLSQHTVLVRKLAVLHAASSVERRE